MSICRFIAANISLTKFASLQEYLINIDIDKGIFTKEKSSVLKEK